MAQQQIYDEDAEGRAARFFKSADAKKRKIKDGDRVRIFNDIGDFYALAKVSPTVRPGTL